MTTAPGTLFSVAGKVVLVTGGTRGIGYMIAEGLLRGGARVYLSSRKADACAEAERELSRFGEVTAIPADLSVVEECGRLIDRIGRDEDGLHVLVNNAGTSWGAPFDRFPAEAWDKVFALNVKAPFVLVQRARSLLESASTAEDPARVINIGSIDGLAVPDFRNYSYGASKAALHHLTSHLADELAPRVLVNAIAPGPFPTRLLASTLDERGEQLRAANPLGRFGTPDDVAGLATFLCSRASSYVTGAVIPLDGGMSTTMKAMVDPAAPG